MGEEDRWYLAPPELLGGQQPAMPGDDPQCRIDEDRHVEAKGADAAGQLADLLWAVRAGTCRVGSQHLDTPPYNRQGRAETRFGFPEVMGHDRGMLSDKVIIVNIGIVNIGITSDLAPRIHGRLA